MKEIQHSVAKHSLILLLLLLLLSTYLFPPICKIKCKRLFKVSMVNECLERRVPRVSRMIETAQHLYYTNKSLIIFGERELELMNKVKNMFILKDSNNNSNNSNSKNNSNISNNSNNTLRYEYIADNKLNNDTNKRIGIELMNIFLNSSEDILLAIPDIFYGYPPIYYKDKVYWKEKKRLRRLLFKYSDYDRQYFTSQISSPYKYSSNGNCELISEVYNIIRDIWKNKNIIIIKSFKHFSCSKAFFNTANDYNIISIPDINSPSLIEEIKKTILKDDKEKVIILLTNNPLFVILGDHLIKEGRRVLMLNDIDKDYCKYKYRNRELFETFSI